MSQDCQALNFLKGTLISGTASTDARPAILPPSQHLAFIATLVVHPTLTTRAKSAERIEASNLALQYLQLVIRHVYVRTDILRDALTFTSQDKTSRRGTSSRRRTTGEGVSPTADNDAGIDSELADAGSLWKRADHFWHIIGWSFNCSILHKHRWERWRALIDLMIGFLEIDWDARQEDLCDLEQSLIMKHINSEVAGAGKERKILRAVFADGQQKAVAEFGEIWQNETKELRKDGKAKKAAAKIDIEADDYGDYMEDENDADLEDSESDPRRPSTESSSDVSQSLGGLDSIPLRIRILSLLSKVSYLLPDAFTQLNNLYYHFCEHIRPLPTPAFFAIMMPSGLRSFEPTAASTLTQYILRSIIASVAPLPPNDNLSQDILEAHYLPFAANTNTLADNTKVSLCVETLLRLLDQHVGLEWTQELVDRAESGIQARKAKVKGRRTKKSTEEGGSCDVTWLESSAERIRMVTEMSRP